LPDGTVREVEFDLSATHAEVRARINEIAPGAWRAKFGEEPPGDINVNYEPRA
jgi:hypothetical protein